MARAPKPNSTKPHDAGIASAFELGTNFAILDSRAWMRTRAALDSLALSIDDAFDDFDRQVSQELDHLARLHCWPARDSFSCLCGHANFWHRDVHRALPGIDTPCSFALPEPCDCPTYRNAEAACGIGRRLTVRR